MAYTANSPQISAGLIAMEKATVAAFKAKAADTFTEHFSKAYVGIANDGFKTADDELAGMRKLDLDSLDVEGAKVAFPAENIGIVTYTMNVKGAAGGQAVQGRIFTSTVYVNTDESWSAVLHTESMAPSGK